MLTQCRALPTFFFFNDTATTEIYTLSLHDALPISPGSIQWSSDAWHTSRETPTRDSGFGMQYADLDTAELAAGRERSEEHTSELQSQSNLVCRLLLEKKKNYHYQLQTNPHPKHDQN